MIDSREPRAAGIIIRDHQILLIKRYKKDWGDYYVLPGGTIENNESPESTLVREIKEETNFDLEIIDSIFEFNNQNVNRYEYYYLMTEPVGEAQFLGPELLEISPDNTYELLWVPLDQLKKINLQPQEIKKIITERFSHS